MSPRCRPKADLNLGNQVGLVRSLFQASRESMHNNRHLRQPQINKHWFKNAGFGSEHAREH